MQVQKKNKKWQMWHPFIQFLFYSLEPRCPTRPSDAFPGCATDNQRELVVGLFLKGRQSRSGTVVNPAEDYVHIWRFLKIDPFCFFCQKSRQWEGQRKTMRVKKKQKKSPNRSFFPHQISWSVVQLEADAWLSSGPTVRCYCTAD